MKHFILPIALSALVVGALTGCLKTRSEIDAEESGQTQQAQTVSQQKAAAQEKAPPAAYRFEEYDEQMRQLTGRVDSTEAAIAQLNANKQTDKDSVGKEKEAIAQKFLSYEDALKKLEAQVAALNDDMARLKTPPAEAAVTPAKGKGLYEAAEELFAGKKWKEAIVNYQKYRDGNRKGKYYADSTYKIGVCFQELSMKDEAKAFLEEVIAKFPGSKEAKKAEFRMKSLK